METDSTALFHNYCSRHGLPIRLLSSGGTVAPTPTFYSNLRRPPFEGIFSSIPDGEFPIGGRQLFKVQVVSFEAGWGVSPMNKITPSLGDLGSAPCGSSS